MYRVLISFRVGLYKREESLKSSFVNGLREDNLVDSDCISQAIKDMDRNMYASRKRNSQGNDNGSNMKNTSALKNMWNNKEGVMANNKTYSKRTRTSLKQSISSLGAITEASAVEEKQNEISSTSFLKTTPFVNRRNNRFVKKNRRSVLTRMMITSLPVIDETEERNF